jgi:phosphorylcholine metabolism protein LicD
MNIIKLIKNNKIIFLIILYILIFIILNILHTCYYNSQKNGSEKEFDKILIWFHNLSEKHNINYSIAYGTMLGYVRNKKYIPYDGDMDLYIGKDDAYKIINLINNDNILYNSDIKKINGLKNDKFYIIINKSHNEKIKDRPRFDCQGKKTNRQVDKCSFNGLFARIIYNRRHCDLYVYTDNNKKDEYHNDCTQIGCCYISTNKGKNLPETKIVKLNNINTRIFKNDKFIHKILSSWYGDDYIKPNHKLKNGKWKKL